jgi:1-acyl-sn-glycerol-3-phosphate acyltransferase
VRGEIHPGEGPVIYVANHIGVLDAPMMLSFVSNTSVVIKQKHARLPIYAALVRYVDFIATQPGSLESLGKMYSDCLKVLTAGTNVLIFPEGTRSRKGKLQAFRDSAFRLAAQTGRPIVPVALFTEVPFMTKGWKSYFPPERFCYEVRFLPPVFSNEGERPMEFADRVRKMIADELKRMQSRGTARSAEKNE